MKHNRTCLGMSLIFVTIFIFTTPLILAEEPILFQDDTQGTMNLSVQKMEYNTPITNILLMSVLIIVLIVIIISLIRYIVRDQKKDRALKEKVKVMDNDEAEYYLEHEDEDIPTHSSHDVDNFLKDEERRIVNILRQRDGLCSQATLRVIGNFSKATLSRLLSELEERNIIKKEKRGKKNLVVLR